MTTAIAVPEYRLAGRTFRPAVPLTAWQVGYFTAHLKAAKADTLVLASQAGHAPSFDDLVESLLVSEHLYYLLAASLVAVRDGVPMAWHNVTADEHARFLAGLTDPQDIGALRPMIYEVLAGFFPVSPASPATSPTSFDPTMARPPHLSGASSGSASGAISPDSSLGTTGTARKPSSRGRRGKSASPPSSD